jgi:hypothetical protein
MAVQRARTLRATSSAELRAFLTGLRTAHTAAVDAAEELYEVGDAAIGDDRREAFARAAGTKLAAERIGKLFDAAAAETPQEKPHGNGVRALLRRLAGVKA